MPYFIVNAFWMIPEWAVAIWIWDGIRLLKNVLQYERRKHHGLEERKRTVL